MLFDAVNSSAIFIRILYESLVAQRSETHFCTVAKLSTLLVLVLSVLVVQAARADADLAPDPTITAIWQDPNRPTNERVSALISQLTLKEKISLLYWLSPSIPRLGIREYHHGDECLHGLVRPGKNTVFPQAIGLGATFDPEMVYQMANSISDEARGQWNRSVDKHFGNFDYPLTLWSPVVNVARDPRWGRTQETYGEDPYLTSRLGVAFVKGLQGSDSHYLKVIATPKHFAGNNEENGRFGKNIVADERYLYEYELYPFRACIEEGKAASIMAAYTAINGIPCSANKWLLTDVLRKQWGFSGYVVSDCGAVSHLVDAHHYANTPEEAIADCLNAGLDMEGGYYAKYPDVVDLYLPSALQQGRLNQDTVDHALSLVLEGRFKLGLYDPDDRVPFSKIQPSVIGSAEHLALARRLADESIVLLKNVPQGNACLLPIDPTKAAKICVVGPNANVMQFGDYSGTPTGTMTPFEGVKERAEKAGMHATLLPWTQSILAVVSSDFLKADSSGRVSGLMGEYFSSPDLSGTPRSQRVDSTLNFNWAHIEPDPLASDSQFSVRWTGELVADITGSYSFSIQADGGDRLLIDDRKILEVGVPKVRPAQPDARRRITTERIDQLVAGKHKILIEYFHDRGETGLVFSWTQPARDDFFSQLKDADLVIAVMGLNTDYEIEGKDRKSILLPADQEDFLRKALAANPRTVAVLESGSSLAVPWESANIPAILQAWYPGQEGAHAIADVLFGDCSPSGRLPLTFYASDEQLRPMSEYDITKGRTYMYLQSKPLYPFGFGLSYTSFRYSNLLLSKTSASKSDQVAVSVDITNTGARDGDDVVQCYVHAQKSDVPMPIRQMWACQRIAVRTGATETISLNLDTKNFAHWDKTQQAFVVEPGAYDIQVGASSDDIRQSGQLQIVK